jgi:hypothetical protein
MLRKNKGKLNGWILYLIKIRATNSGRTAEESGINSGNWYNSNFELHNVATSSYNLNEKWSLEPTLHCRQDNLQAFQMANMNT